MKKVIFLLIPVLITFASCTKDSINNSPSPTTGSNTGTTSPVNNNQGYIILKCDNCKIDYGMPDQYQGYNVSGTSVKMPYTYKFNYNLQANIYALDHDQTLTYSVFDTKGKQVFSNSIEQSVEDYWQVNVLLP